MTVWFILIGFQAIEIQSREVESFEFDWKFSLGDFSKASDEDFYDEDWRELNLPHDWSIEGEYSESNPGAIQMGFLPGGIGWYRKTFEWNRSWKDKMVSVEFDGVYMNSEVWINGNYLGKRPYGYIGFSYDLTKYLKDGNNVIAVRVDNSKQPSGRWYTGSGIYRSVRLVVKDPLHIKQWGTYATTPVANEALGVLRVETALMNQTETLRKTNLKLSLFDQSGRKVSSSAAIAELSGNDESLIYSTLKIDTPSLWSPGAPNLYTLVSELLEGNRLLDREEIKVGFRSAIMDPDQGFILNGEQVKLKGVCMHHDAGALGSAVPKSILKERLLMLKEMGCNAIRVGHTPFAPEFYDYCDEIGFLVMDEAFDGWWDPKVPHDYGFYFDEWWQRDLGDLVKRDRSHPSVVIWSVGNEVHGYTNSEQKLLVDTIRTLDNTRPITQGRGYAGPHIDIAGFNGFGEFRGTLEKYRKENPHRPIIGTEITHTLQTRGAYRSKTWYRIRDNPAPWERGRSFDTIEDRVFKIDDFTEEEFFPEENSYYDSGYDNSIVRIGVRDDLTRVRDMDFYSGNFRWTGFDYLGESFGWPARTANFGVIDLAGLPKDHYYLYQSLWSKKPMAHLLPHWTHSGKEGRKVPVVAYTNAEEAELFLNGKSMGKKIVDPSKETYWIIEYEPGEIRLEATTSGELVAKTTQVTAGEPAKISLSANRLELLANGSDVVRVVVQVEDAAGIMCPMADNRIHFSVEGPGELVAVENGDILDIERHGNKSRKAFRGLCVGYVRITGEGTVNVRCNSDDLNSASLTLYSSFDNEN
ncbi:DUF4982 domain-containing protein [Puniceicoccaceae bacterium K14]|nr:DUF4982 domain-containing protein [Puniceicoccaceae bacterium K14]